LNGSKGHTSYYFSFYYILSIKHIFFSFIYIHNLKEKNPKMEIGPTILDDCERSVTRTLFMEENSDGERLN